jgi:hypothetical protein
MSGKDRLDLVNVLTRTHASEPLKFEMIKRSWPDKVHPSRRDSNNLS